MINYLSPNDNWWFSPVLDPLLLVDSASLCWFTMFAGWIPIESMRKSPIRSRIFWVLNHHFLRVKHPVPSHFNWFKDPVSSNSNWFEHHPFIPIFVGDPHHVPSIRAGSGWIWVTAPKPLAASQPGSAGKPSRQSLICGGGSSLKRAGAPGAGRIWPKGGQGFSTRNLKLGWSSN